MATLSTSSNGNSKNKKEENTDENKDKDKDKEEEIETEEELRHAIDARDLKSDYVPPQWETVQTWVQSGLMTNFQRRIKYQNAYREHQENVSHRYVTMADFVANKYLSIPLKPSSTHDNKL